MRLNAWLMVAEDYQEESRRNYEAARILMDSRGSEMRRELYQMRGAAMSKLARNARDNATRKGA